MKRIIIALLSLSIIPASHAMNTDFGRGLAFFAKSEASTLAKAAFATAVGYAASNNVSTHAFVAPLNALTAKYGVNTAALPYVAQAAQGTVLDLKTGEIIAGLKDLGINTVNLVGKTAVTGINLLSGTAKFFSNNQWALVALIGVAGVYQFRHNTYVRATLDKLVGYGEQTLQKLGLISKKIDESTKQLMEEFVIVKAELATLKDKTSQRFTDLSLQLNQLETALKKEFGDKFTAFQTAMNLQINTLIKDNAEMKNQLAQIIETQKQLLSNQGEQTSMFSRWFGNK